MFLHVPPPNTCHKCNQVARGNDPAATFAEMSVSASLHLTRKHKLSISKSKP